MCTYDHSFKDVVQKKLLHYIILVIILIAYPQGQVCIANMEI